MQARHRYAFSRCPGALCQANQAVVRLLELAGEKLAFSQVQCQGKAQFVRMSCAPLVEQLLTHAQVGQRRTIGRGSLGTAPGQQVEFCQLLAFEIGVDQRRPAVELADHLENGFFAVMGRYLVGQQATDTQVHGSPLIFGDHGIGCFMDAVVNEGTGILLLCHQLQPNSSPQHSLHARHRQVEHQGKGSCMRHVPQARQVLQRLAGGQRQAGKLADHQVDDVVGVALGMDALRIPAPAPGSVVVGQ
ncbi:hypothetical protein D3C80_1273940 [compost metagenome]